MEVCLPLTEVDNLPRDLSFAKISLCLGFLIAFIDSYIISTLKKKGFKGEQKVSIELGQVCVFNVGNTK